MKGMSGIDFYRYIGCDILLLNNRGIQPGFSSPALVWSEKVMVSSRIDDGKRIQELQMPGGILRTIYQDGHPIKYLVTSWMKRNGLNSTFPPKPPFEVPRKFMRLTNATEPPF